MHFWFIESRNATAARSETLLQAVFFYEYAPKARRIDQLERLFLIGKKLKRRVLCVPDDILCFLQGQMHAPEKRCGEVHGPRETAQLTLFFLESFLVRSHACLKLP
jgi:hypothetical protein